MIATGAFLLGLLAGLGLKHPDSFIPFWLQTAVAGAAGGFVILVAFGLLDFLTSKARREERANTVRCFDCGNTNDVHKFSIPVHEDDKVPQLRCPCGSLNNSWNSLQKELALGRKVQAGD